MAVIRRPLIRDLLDIQERMNHLFDEFFVRSRDSGDISGRWLPPVDIYETESEVVLLAEVPGMDENDVDIEISDNVITIRGRRKRRPGREDEHIYCLERAHGPFMRAFNLPGEVDRDSVKASLRQGLLKVVLPKTKAKRAVGVFKVELN